jgi:lysine-N-methylase
MEKFYPDYYKKFKCIANLCPDSCCQGWDVVVDEKSENYYDSVQGSFGEKIRKVTVTDEDGDRIFTLENDRCPFWNKDELCDIYINLGEEHLCDTCKKFPRITMDYGSFTEYTLSLACPKAAELILNNDFIIPEKNYRLDNDYYNAEDMEQLLKERKQAEKILLTEGLSFKEKLKNLIEFFSEGLSTTDKNYKFIFDIHERLEFINPEYSEIIKNSYGNSLSEGFDDIYTRMAVYYIYRYFLNAIEDMNITNVIKKIFCAYIITASIAFFENNPDIIRIIQNYSKEVEHSYDNNATLEFFFENDERFNLENLISFLE